MWKRSDNTDLALLFATAVLALLGHSIFNILFEEWLKHHLQAYFGLTVAEMIERFGAISAPVLASIAIIWIVYGLGVRERGKKSPLEIRYSPENPRCVETKILLHGSASRYYIGIFNQTVDRTVHDVEVTWDPTAFTRYINGAVRERYFGEDRNTLHRAASIDPQETQYSYLFGWDDKVLTVSDSLDILNRVNTFTIRARGKDATEVTAEFQYNPFKFPKLIRLR